MNIENILSNNLDVSLNNNLNNRLEIKQTSFLQGTLGKAINNGVYIGLRYLLPNWAEDKVIELKDNLLNFGLK